MSELKTLKDLMLPYTTLDGSNGWIDPLKLRSEAIKWVKELLNGSNIIWKEDHPFYNFRHDVYPIADFIKERFNITEEELR